MLSNRPIRCVIYASIAVSFSLFGLACSDDGVQAAADTGVADGADSHGGDIQPDAGIVSDADVDPDADPDAGPTPDIDAESGLDGGFDADTQPDPTVEPDQIQILTSPSSAAAGDTLSASFQLLDAMNRPVELAGVDITITLNKHQFVDGDTAKVASTDEAGIARFEFMISVVDWGYNLTITSDHRALSGVPISSNYFEIFTGPASAETSSISGADGVVDEPAGVPITIELFDAFGNPVVGSTPLFSATGEGNTYGACSETDAAGLSTCSMRSSQAGPKTLQIDAPVEVVGDIIEFVGSVQVEPNCDASATPFGGGSGEVDDPYLICAPAHLNAIGDDPNYMTKDFVVAQEIDMQGVQDFNIIGSETHPYLGVFDGRHHSIKNLVIQRETEAYVALFSHVGQLTPFRYGYVRNIVLEDVDIKGGGGATGGVVSHCIGQLKNAHVTGSVEGSGEFTGGLSGDGNCVITDSHFAGSVKGEMRVGGVAGFSGGAIKNSYSSGSVEGVDYVGGLTAYNYGVIQNAYSTANVQGEFHVGGLVGFNTSRDVQHTYSSGSVTGLGSMSDLGGLIGKDLYPESVVQSYCDSDTSDIALGESGIALSTADFGDASKFVGWDFVDTWVIGAAPDGQTRPILQWQQD